MFLKWGFSFLFTLLPILTMAQFNIVGLVKTSENKPLQNVTVIVSSGSTTVSYTSSDELGGFTFNLEEGLYAFKFSYLGYKTVIQEITISKNLDLGIINMEASTFEIEEVFLKAQAAIIKRGDTTIYNHKKFVNGSERNLEDVLKTLPGIDTNEEGKITVNGKVIDELLIEGEDLFKKQHSSATRNISPEMVKRIEVIENYKSLENLSSIDKTGLTALNIKVTDAFKNKITGFTQIGAGINNAYTFNAALFNLRDKFKVSFIADANTTGASALSIQDYFELTDTFEEFKKPTESGVAFTSLEDIPSFLTMGNNVSERDVNYNSLSMIYTPTSKLKLDFYSIYNFTNQEEILDTDRRIQAGNDFISFSEENKINEKNHFAIGHLKAVFKQDENTLFKLDSDINLDIINQTERLLNLQNDQTQAIASDQDINSFETKTNFSFKKKFKKSETNASVYLLNTNKDNTLDILSDDTFLDTTFSNNNFSLFQEYQLNTTEFGLTLNHDIKLKQFGISFNGQQTFEDNRFKSFTDNDNFLANALELNTNLSSIGTEITYKPSKQFSFNAGITGNYFESKFNRNPTTIDTYLGFNSGIKYKRTNNHTFQLNYKFENSLPSIENLIENRLVTNYRNVIFNNDVLANTLLRFNEIGFEQFLFKTEKDMALIVNASYKFSPRSINTNIINEENSTTTQDRIINNNTSKAAFVFFEKGVLSKKHKIATSFSISETERTFFNNNVSSLFVNNGLSGYISLGSKFKKGNVHFSIGYSFTSNRFRSNGTQTSQITHKPFASFYGTVFNSIKWRVDSRYEYYDADNQNREVLFINPELYYSPIKSNWEFSLIGSNILNLENNNIILNNSTEATLETRRSEILPGNIVFKAKLRF